MPRKIIIERPRCDKCKGTGRVPSRLPFRGKPCEWCGSKGIKETKPTIARIGKPRRR